MQDGRFLKIIEYLKEHQTATLAELAELNHVSVDTTRRDVDKMDQAKMLRKVRGGAVYHNDELTTQRVNIRKISNKEEKGQIARLLCNYIVDGQCIALNSGNTCAAVAQYLVEKYFRLTVITNNLQAIKILSQKNDFMLVVPGGIVDGKEEAFYGEMCEKEIRKYNIDVAVLGIYGISLEKGVTDFRIRQAGVMQSMLESASKTIVLADSSKFGKVSYVNVCDLNDINLVISDQRISDEVKEQYAARGVEIVTE